MNRLLQRLYNYQTWRREDDPISSARPFTVMGLRCSCLKHSHKYQRRRSDDLDSLDMEQGDDDSDHELEVLVKAHELLGASPSSSSDEWGRRKGGLKRNGSFAGAAIMAEGNRRRDEEENEEKVMHRSPDLRLMGRDTDYHLTSLPRPEELSRLLRSYQEITGIIDEGQLDLECIMCLETFSKDNPRVRTLCNCGINRSNFHTSCLLEWLNRDVNCPVCRDYLFFEDS